ncbi:Holliday junction resolvase RuvX [bacterium]|nr:Holliday junction resolvase RuvX [bacterium]
MKRVIGVDYGRKRIGISVTDPLGMTAQPLETLHSGSWKETADHLGGLVTRFDAGEVVIGHPLLLSGERGSMAKESERFAGYLRNVLPIPVILWDERLSSTETRRTLQAMGEKTGKDKGRIDRMAAALFLQTYLDSHRGPGYGGSE